MRAVLVDRILDAHDRFKLTPDTLYLTIYIMDLYISLQPILQWELQLVGVSAMLIVCKYEETWAPEVHRKLFISLSVLCSFPVLLFKFFF
jgi:cyclin B